MACSVSGLIQSSTEVKDALKDWFSTIIGTNAGDAADGKVVDDHINNVTNDHDDRYYTKTESNTKFDEKADSDHLHDDRYQLKQRTAYGYAYTTDSKSYTVDSTGIIVIEQGDEKVDGDGWIDLATMKITAQYDCMITIVAQVSTNTDQTSEGDGVAILCKINGVELSTRGEFTRGGSSDNGEELRFLFVNPTILSQGDEVEFWLSSLTEGKTYNSMGHQIKFNALEIV